MLDWNPISALYVLLLLWEENALLKGTILTEGQ